MEDLVSEETLEAVFAPKVLANNSDQLKRQAGKERMRKFYDVLRDHYPHLAQDHGWLATVEWRMFRDGVPLDGMRVRFVNEADPNDRVGEEKILPDKEAIAVLVQPDNPDARWLKRANSPVVPSAIDKAAEKEAHRQAELAFEWSRIPPFTRAILQIADSAVGERRRILLDIARATAVDATVPPGAPPAAITEFLNRRS
jgi:hypothetical protein